LTYKTCRESHSSIYRFAKGFGMTVGQLRKVLLE
jgi:hypothetical protein